MKTITFHDQWNTKHCVRIDCIVAVEAFVVPDLDPQQANASAIDGSRLILRNVPADDKIKLARTPLAEIRAAMEDTA